MLTSPPTVHRDVPISIPHDIALHRSLSSVSGFRKQNFRHVNTYIGFYETLRCYVGLDNNIERLEPMIVSQYITLAQKTKEL